MRMRKSTLLKSLMATAMGLGIAGSATAADWEMSLKLTNALTVFTTSDGTVLASDQDYDSKGGIYYSTDEGDSWTKSNVADWQYNTYVEADDYIFATGEGCRIARSEDGGKTWLVLNYSRTIEDYVSAKEIDYVTAYGLAYDPELQRLYVAVYANSVGIIYSDDFGVTWQFTDRKSLMVIDGGMDNFYKLVMFNNKLVAFGLYLAYEYNAEANTWSVVKDLDGQAFVSNCMSSVTVKDGVLYGGRAMENTDGFVYCTSDLTSWTALPAPDDCKTGYVRALTSDSECLYAATLKMGIYYSADNGESWKLTGDGFNKSTQYPEENEDFTCSVAVSENYLFCAQFNAYSASMNKTSGIYRIKKSELGQTSIAEVTTDNTPVVSICGDMIEVAGEAADITVISLAGNTVLSAHTNSLSTASLCSGAYIYKVSGSNSSVSGKFVK